MTIKKESLDLVYVSWLKALIVAITILTASSFIGYSSLLIIQEIYLISSPRILFASYIICSCFTMALMSLYVRLELWLR